MKKIIGVLTIIVVGLNACEKQPFDYRNKFVGEYEFTTHILQQNINCCDNNLSCCYTETVVVFIGEVSLGKKEDEIGSAYFEKEENTILIKYIDEKNKFDSSYFGWEVEDGILKVSVNRDGSINYLNESDFNNKGEVNFKLVFGKTAFVVHEVYGKKL